MLLWQNSMSKCRGSLFLVLLAAALSAKAADSVDLTAQYKATANRLIDAALVDEAGYAKLSYLCDRIGNRLSGSASLPKAIAWAADQMKKDGLVNVSTPPVKVPHWVRGQESAALLSPVERSLHMLGLGMSVATPAGGVTADVVVVSSFDELNTLGKTVTGKIVLFNAPYEGYGRTVQYRVNGASQAAALGAVAVLVRSITPLAMQIPHTGTLEYAPGAPKIAAAAVSIEDAMLIDRLQRSGATPRVHLEMSAHLEPDADAANVVGEIPGSEHPEQVVVLGGHIDSWDVGQGAQDDGSGIMAALEAAALIQKLGLKPKRTIRIVFWVNEENGSRGADAYRDWIGDKVKDHVAAIEMDGGAETPLGFGYGAFGRRRRLAPGVAPEPTPAPTPEQVESINMCQQIAKLLEYKLDAGQVHARRGRHRHWTDHEKRRPGTQPYYVRRALLRLAPHRLRYRR